jgi:hypothetical protein
MGSRSPTTPSPTPDSTLARRSADAWVRAALSLAALTSIASVSTSARAEEDKLRVEGDIGVPIPLQAPERVGSYGAGMSVEIHALYLVGPWRLGAFGNLGGANWTPGVQNGADTSFVPWWSAGGTLSVRILAGTNVAWLAGVDLGVGMIHAKSVNASFAPGPAGAGWTGVEILVADRTVLTLRGSAGLISDTVYPQPSPPTAAGDPPPFSQDGKVAFVRLAIGAGYTF